MPGLQLVIPLEELALLRLHGACTLSVLWRQAKVALQEPASSPDTPRSAGWGLLLCGKSSDRLAVGSHTVALESLVDRCPAPSSRTKTRCCQHDPQTGLALAPLAREELLRASRQAAEQQRPLARRT